jgi:hypothetical protein
LMLFVLALTGTARGLLKVEENSGRLAGFLPGGPWCGPQAVRKDESCGAQKEAVALWEFGLMGLRKEVKMLFIGAAKRHKLYPTTLRKRLAQNGSECKHYLAGPSGPGAVEPQRESGRSEPADQRQSVR